MAVFLLLLLRRDPALLRVKGKELAFFAFTGVCGLFLVQFCMLLSLQFAPVGVCSFTQSSSTIMVCLCSVALFHERISREKRLGIAVGLTGLAFVVWNPEILQGGRMFAWGVLAATVSAFLILGEPLLWNHLLGAALTVTSVLLIHRDTEREP